jgi:fumarate reductase subunit D
MAASLLSNYVALILVIILWCSMWSLAETLGKKHLQTHAGKLKFYGSTVAVTSLLLVTFFPQHLFL